MSNRHLNLVEMKTYSKKTYLLLHFVKFPHEFPVNIIFDHKGQPAVKDYGILAKYAFAITQVEDEQVRAARIKGM